MLVVFDPIILSTDGNNGFQLIKEHVKLELEFNFNFIQFCFKKSNYNILSLDRDKIKVWNN